MDAFSPLKNLLRQADEAGSRSTALKIPAWIIGILLAGLLTSSAGVGMLSVPDWVPILLAVLLVLALTFTAWAYYRFVTDKQFDALRSEAFALRKLAIEHGFLGDSLFGLRDARDITPTRLQGETEQSRLGDER